MSDQPKQAQVELTDAELAHMNYIRKKGLPSVRRAQELKEQLGRKILATQAVGGEDHDSLDAFSIVNEWLMIHTDARLMQAFSVIAMGDIQTARGIKKESGN